MTPRAARITRPRDPVPMNRGERILRLVRRIPFRGVPWVALIAIAGAGAGFAHWVTTTSYFHASEWIVSGTERLTETEVLHLAGKPPEDDVPLHLLYFRPDFAASEIDAHPLVHHAEVFRRFPQSVEIRVIEREPAAILIAGEEPMLMDWEGVVFAPAGGAELLDLNLPVITANLPRPPRIGEVLPEALTNQALTYALTLSETESRVGGDVSEVHWEPERGITLVMRSGARLVCGGTPPETTLPRAEAFAEKHGGFSGVEYADLRIESHLPWRPAEQIVQTRRN